jgi:AcrR family transcriptional regulator
MSTPNLSRRERKKQETKAGILKAARHLFEEKGFENTSIDEITTKADVAKGTFFYHFPTKDALLSGIAEEEVEDILFFAAEELGDISGSLQKIRRIMIRLLEDALPYLRLTGRVLFSAIINTGDNASPFVKINELLEELVIEGQRNLEITDRFVPREIVTAILGCYYGVLFRWFEYGAIQGKAKELDHGLTILFDGIREIR